MEHSIRLMPSEWAAIDRVREPLGLSRSQFMRIAVIDRVSVPPDDEATERPSPRRRTPWSRRSIAEALGRFQQLGVVEKFSYPGSGNPRWRVTLVGYPEAMNLTPSQAYALCVGMETGRTYGRGADRAPGAAVEAL